MKQPQGQWILNNFNKPLDLRTLPRCQAIAKSTGKRCGNAAVKGKRVCYIHGGKSSGAPKNNKNAYKHGRFSAKVIEEQKLVRHLLEDIRQTFIQCDTL